MFDFSQSRALHFDGRRWKLSNPDAVLPKHTKNSVTFFGEPASAGENVWMVTHGGLWLLASENMSDQDGGHRWRVPSSHQGGFREAADGRGRS